MKVKELIEKLEKINSEWEIKVCGMNDAPVTDCFPAADGKELGVITVD
ncbi:MAG: hypothetical protein ACTSRU_17490 [Candidatus Hodarchaeales archaeon]